MRGRGTQEQGLRFKASPASGQGTAAHTRLQRILNLVSWVFLSFLILTAVSNGNYLGSTCIASGTAMHRCGSRCSSSQHTVARRQWQQPALTRAPVTLRVAGAPEGLATAQHLHLASARRAMFKKSRISVTSFGCEMQVSEQCARVNKATPAAGSRAPGVAPGSSTQPSTARLHSVVHAVRRMHAPWLMCRTVYNSV